MTKYFYHYTTRTRWYDIQRELRRRGTSAALLPRSPFIDVVGKYGLPSKAHENAIWGATSPMPRPWLAHPQSHRFLLSLFNHIASEDLFDPTICLLKIDIDPADDLYVADWGTMRNESRSLTNRLHDYWNSLIPFRDYSEEADNIRLFPEVVCFTPIPADRISLQRIIPAEDRKEFISTPQEYLQTRAPA